MGVPSSERSESKLEVVKKSFDIHKSIIDLIDVKKVFNKSMVSQELAKRIYENAISLSTSALEASTLNVKSERLFERKLSAIYDARRCCINIDCCLQIAYEANVSSITEKQLTQFIMRIVEEENLLDAWITSSHNAREKFLSKKVHK